MSHSFKTEFRIDPSLAFEAEVMVENIDPRSLDLWATCTDLGAQAADPSWLLNA